jgi:hypothetical protein
MNNKELIFEYIKNNPGCTNDQIHRAIRLKYNAVKNHTGNLVKDLKIITKKKKGYRKIFNTFYCKKNNVLTCDKKETLIPVKLNTPKLIAFRKEARKVALNSEQRMRYTYAQNIQKQQIKHI